MAENPYRTDILNWPDDDAVTWDEGFEAGRRAEAQRLRDALTGDEMARRMFQTYPSSGIEETKRLMGLVATHLAALDQEEK